MATEIRKGGNVPVVKRHFGAFLCKRSQMGTWQLRGAFDIVYWAWKGVLHSEPYKRIKVPLRLYMLFLFWDDVSVVYDEIFVDETYYFVVKKLDWRCAKEGNMGWILVLSQVLAVVLSRPKNEPEEKAVHPNLPPKSIKPKNIVRVLVTQQVFLINLLQMSK